MVNFSKRVGSFFGLFFYYSFNLIDTDENAHTEHVPHSTIMPLETEHCLGEICESLA